MNFALLAADLGGRKATERSVTVESQQRLTALEGGG